ncbi:MAG TPA: hypothetical protein VGK41_05550 [Solirubrobacterales bacterium]
MIVAIPAFALGALLGAFCLALFVAGGKEPACITCHGDRVTVVAGDLERDDGYCELRSCPTCSTGQRLGRSDVPIIRNEDVLAKAAEHRDTSAP